MLPASAGMILTEKLLLDHIERVPCILGDDLKGHLMDALRFTNMTGDDQKILEDFIRERASRVCACTRRDNIHEDLIDGYTSRHPLIEKWVEPNAWSGIRWVMRTGE